MLIIPFGLLSNNAITKTKKTNPIITEKNASIGKNKLAFVFDIIEYDNNIAPISIPKIL